MQVGVCLPYMEAGITRGTLVDWCRAIEAGPFASLSCGERISGADAMEMRAMKATGIDELYMVPASADVAEVERLAELAERI